MAISEVHYRLLEQLRDENKLPQKGDLLEIGEANWYGDLDAKSIGIDCTSDREIVLEVYDKLMQPQSITSIDQSGGKEAIKHDLNYPLDLEMKFDVIFNHGTAEHVFRSANVFEIMHAHCELGGVMIHEGPWRGWDDHGFICFQPTTFWDVAHANNYRIELLAGEDITNKKSIRFESREQIHADIKAGLLSGHWCLFVAYRKLFEQPFKYPQQHIYSPFATDKTRLAWAEMR